MNIPLTAEEILIKAHWDGIQNHKLDQSRVEEAMIEFARLHVKVALEAAADNAEVQFNSDEFRYTFLNCYPKSNIK